MNDLKEIPTAETGIRLTFQVKNSPLVPCLVRPAMILKTAQSKIENVGGTEAECLKCCNRD